jgi:hypothetical protein
MPGAVTAQSHISLQRQPHTFQKSSCPLDFLPEMSARHLTPLLQLGPALSKLQSPGEKALEGITVTLCNSLKVRGLLAICQAPSEPQC